MPEVIAQFFSIEIYLLSFFFYLIFADSQCKPCKERASNCLPHNEHLFSYFTCVMALFGWSCHHALLFRCTNIRNFGKSHQDAKIMTCYIHKHMLYTVDVPPNKFQVYLNHVCSVRPCGKQRHEWTSRWI